MYVKKYNSSLQKSSKIVLYLVKLYFYLICRVLRLKIIASAIFLWGALSSALCQEVPSNLFWNETLIEAIRLDVARPVVHARNLYHHGLGMYNLFVRHADQLGFAAIDPMLDAETWSSISLSTSADLELAWAAYSLRFIQIRFANSPGISEVEGVLEEKVLEQYGMAVSDLLSVNSIAMSAALYAEEVTDWFLEDGSNEANGYANTCYAPSNTPLELVSPLNTCGNSLEDLNKWQPLAFDGTEQPFLGANWGMVEPFALPEAAALDVTRDGCSYRLHFDPGAPGLMGEDLENEMYEYQKGFGLVVEWQQYLNPDDAIVWNTSPNSRGNINVYPDMPDVFYAAPDGEIGNGRAFNPVTLLPYSDEWVSRADYTRSLAEFWADGPNSETPPGHWFTILNEVVLHADFIPAWKGEEEMTLTAWLAKAYLLFGGSMHDCSIAAWGAKAYYDFIRPISAIRNMASLGQASNPEATSYHPDGILLIDGAVEIISAGDPLLEENVDYLGQIKIKQWIPDADSGSEPSFDWRPGCEWLPYQLPSFVTPPFAGYLSGHSTFSRSAAELLTFMTGSPYFPGGEGVFEINSDFLLFDEGPSEAFKLRWATYRDAANESGLSRIWGGIHPPMDDLRGRLLGAQVAESSIIRGEELFSAVISGCTYSSAFNYSETANEDNGSCLFEEESTSCAEDLNEDGIVGTSDLLMLLGVFSFTCD